MKITLLIIFAIIPYCVFTSAFPIIGERIVLNPGDIYELDDRVRSQSKSLPVSAREHARL